MPGGEAIMQEINTVGYSLFFVLPAIAVLIGAASLLVPRRQETSSTDRETRTHRKSRPVLTEGGYFSAEPGYALLAGFEIPR